MRRNSPARRNASLEKANRLLLAFSEATPELGVMDLARRVGLNKSTVSRFVATLYELGLLERVENGRKYRLGLRVFELGMLAARHRPLFLHAEDVADRLAEELRETVTLGVLIGHDLVFLHKAERGSDAFPAAIGRRYPPNCSAAGKVLAAALPELQRAALLAGRLGRRTERSSVEARALERELVEVRELGYGLDHEEFHAGVRSVAVPILDRNGSTLAALAVSGSVRRIGPANVPSLSAKLRRAAREISRRLGHRGRVQPRPANAALEDKQGESGDAEVPVRAGLSA